MIVLDTNVVSELQGRQHTERLLAWLDGYAIETLFLTTITIAEIRFGIALLPGGRRRISLRHALERIEAEFEGRILGFSIAAAHLYGDLSAVRKLKGHSMETRNAMIAATCLAHGAALATRNTKDFEGLDLTLVNPFEEG